MSKIFAVSDIHGFYDELIAALNDAGFDKDNPDHMLVVCGDYFDRGPKPFEVMTYLQSLPNKVLVKGNHEDLIMDCINRGYYLSHDVSNGTVRTIIDLAPNAKTFEVACSVAYEKICDFFSSMVDYYETEHYIFVHAFVPLSCNDGLPAHYTRGRKFTKMDNWREASAQQWYQAKWGNPYLLAEQGLLPDKTLVFGHFHTSFARKQYEGKPEWGEEANFDTYYGDGYIAIDACTAYSKKVNVLVIED